MAVLSRPSLSKGTPPTVTAEKGTMDESPCSPMEKALTLRRSVPAAWAMARMSRAVSSRVPVLKHWVRGRESCLRR